MSDTQSTDPFGFFSENGREFVFARFDTPRPWINYAWNSQLLVSVDQRGRGYSLYRDGEGRRTNPIRDRLVYLKDLESGRIWTVGWDPVQMPFEHYHCRHGLGYTVIACEFEGIHCELRITAAADIPAEIWSLKVNNKADKPRRIAVYPAVEFDLGGWIPYGTVENYSICRMVGDRLLLALNQSAERPGARNHAWFSEPQARSLRDEEAGVSGRSLLEPCQPDGSERPSIDGHGCGDGGFHRRFPVSARSGSRRGVGRVFLGRRLPRRG
jgi:hypothetical protein